MTCAMMVYCEGACSRQEGSVVEQARWESFGLVTHNYQEPNLEQLREASCFEHAETVKGAAE